MKLKEDKDHRLLLSDLTPEEQKLFAVAVGVTPCRGMAEFSQAPVPPFVTDFDTAIIAGGLVKDDEGKLLFGFAPGIRDPKTGQILVGARYYTPDFKLPEK